MEIKSSQQKSWMLVVAKKVWRHRRYLWGSGLLCALLILACGAYLYKKGLPARAKRLNMSLIRNAVRGRLSKPEHIFIDVKYKDFQKLAYKREVALDMGALIVSDDDDVPAKIRHGDKTVKVKLRLKGDITDHLQGDKWSFRIEVRGDDTLFGMKRFSIQHPKLRSYIYEWVFHQALKREGVIGLRYEFIHVTLNGKDLGIYALEEHFEKRLIEHNQHREGPIVKFNENIMWEEFAQQYSPFPHAARNGCGHYLSSDIDTFQTGRWLSDPASYPQYLKAIHLLESFRRGVLKTSDVFDLQKLAAFYAVSDLTSAEHAAIVWHNLRFYYNPVTSRLEPIGFDAESEKLIKSLCATKVGVRLGDTSTRVFDNCTAMIFNDPVFFQQYIKALERISQPSYLDKLLADLHDEMERKLSILYKEFPYHDTSTDVREALSQNQKYIQTALNPVKGLHAYHHKSLKDRIELRLGNIQSLPIEVLSVSHKDSTRLLPTERIILPSNLPSQPVDYRNVSFRFPEGLVWSDTMISDLKVNYKILGASRMRQETVFPWPYLDDHFVANDFIRRRPNVDSFAFLVRDESRRRIFIKPGVWDLKQSLIIPGGYKVVCGEGTHLNLSNAATILSYSPLEFRGTEENPICIQSADSTDQGLVVMKANESSVLEYVVFKNLSNPSKNGWELTGAVTFYESPVDISHCQFVGNRSEDSLNIIRSKFTVDSTLFMQTSSDAFDADFCEGKVTRSSFVQCGNDGIDVSGSVVEIENITVNGAGDKGVSVGENSRARAAHVRIRNAEIAVASKDMAHLDVHDVSIADSQIGFTLYQKKSEFAHATMSVTGLDMKKVKVPYLVEERSTLTVDGTVIAPSRKNVKDILYGVEYGKASK